MVVKLVLVNSLGMFPNPRAMSRKEEDPGVILTRITRHRYIRKRKDSHVLKGRRWIVGQGFGERVKVHKQGRYRSEEL